jgi:hypothetical protein
VYERAIPGVPKAERMSVVELYVSRATDFFGVAKVGVVLLACVLALSLGAESSIPNQPNVVLAGVTFSADVSFSYHLCSMQTLWPPDVSRMQKLSWGGFVPCR